MLTLEEYEAEIEKGLDLGRQGYALISRSLLGIKATRLWVDDYSSFSAYAKIKWGFAKAHAYRLLSAGSFLAILESSPIGDKIEPPPNESICRELMRVKAWKKTDIGWRIDEGATKQKQIDVWGMVSSQLNGQVMIAEDVRMLVDKHSGRGVKDGPSLDKRKKQALMLLGKAMDRFCAISWTDRERRTYGEQVRDRVTGW